MVLIMLIKIIILKDLLSFAFRIKYREVKQHFQLLECFNKTEERF